MHRRRFIATAVAMLATPLAYEAQSARRIWRIAILSPGSGRSPGDDAFDDAMQQLGYVQGENLLIERRDLESRYDAADQAVRDVLRLNVDVIVTWAIQTTAAAKRATNRVPIVFIAVRGPVERGLVPSLARPGGNLTGISTYPVETIDPKLFELAKELIPRVSRVAVLSSSADPPGATDARQSAARTLGLKLTLIPFSNNTDAENAPAAVERSQAQMLIAPDTPLLYVRRRDIVQLAITRRLPVVYAFREAVEDGGLMALSTDLKALARRAAAYVDKIFKGVKPGDLPVEQPTTLQLAINMKTAKALGLTIPRTLLLRADQVIE